MATAVEIGKEKSGETGEGKRGEETSGDVEAEREREKVGKGKVERIIQEHERKIHTGEKWTHHFICLLFTGLNSTLFYG